MSRTENFLHATGLTGKNILINIDQYMYIYLVLDDSVQAVFLGHVPKEMESACHNWAFHYQKKPNNQTCEERNLV